MAKPSAPAPITPVRCWIMAQLCLGNNERGKLGNGSSANDNVTTPGSVLNLSNVRSISAGLETSNSHTCAVLDNGSAMCWGIIIEDN